MKQIMTIPDSNAFVKKPDCATEISGIKKIMLPMLL